MAETYFLRKTAHHRAHAPLTTDPAAVEDPLVGRTAPVTGCGQHIGRAVAPA